MECKPFWMLASAEIAHASGCVATEATIAELERCSAEGIAAVEAIVGCNRTGLDRPTATSRELIKRGVMWADHVLEAPRSWLLGALYVLLTVSFGVAPVSSLLGKLYYKQVSLRYAGLDARGARALAEALRVNECIEALDLSGNAIAAGSLGNEGSAAHAAKPQGTIRTNIVGEALLAANIW